MQPHADSSYFASGQSKAEVYTQVLEQTQGLLSGQRNWVSAIPCDRRVPTRDPSELHL